MKFTQEWEAVRNLIDKDIRDVFEQPQFDDYDKQIRPAQYFIPHAALVASILQLAKVYSTKK